MVFTVCGKCGREYYLEPGENPADFRCECGGDLKTFSSEELLEKPYHTQEISKNTKEDTSEGTSPNWFNKQRGILKVTIVIGGCCMVLFFILFLSSLFYGEVSLNLTSEQIKQYARPIDPTTLTDNEWNSLRGKPVKFRAVAYRPYGSGRLDVNAVNGKTYKHVVVFGDVVGVTAINYADVVDIYGIYVGNTETVTGPTMGSQTKAPTIKQAIIIPTGQQYPMYTANT